MKRGPFMAALAAVACATGAGAAVNAADSAARNGSELHPQGTLPPLDGATGWLNSKPLTRAGLRGKVVLLDVWTYSCINWIRSYPYVAAWQRKYSEKGLVVIGIHAPEFTFEHDATNVERAAKAMGVQYPIAIDSEYVLWNALKNEYWPALYLVDARGSIRYHKFGEGDYDQTERAIQQLLVEAGSSDVASALASVHGQGLEEAADWDSLQSNENYVGYGRTENFASLESLSPGRAALYTPPSSLALNNWALSGDWTVGQESAVSNKPNGRVRYHFHARDLHLVMGPAARGVPVQFRVLLDGQPPGSAHGIDVDTQGYGRIMDPRLYQLIRQPGDVHDRQFEITFFESGAHVYSFTFG